MCTVLLFVIWLLCGAWGDEGRDLIRGFSTDGPQAWTMSHRAGLWQHQSAPTEMLRVTDEDILEFLPFPGDKNTAVYASIYIYPKETIQGSLRFRVEHFGVEASKIRIDIDIHYLNGTIFHVEEPLKESDRTCFIIAKYGAIRALMMHITLEQKTETHIQLKNVLLTAQQTFSPHMDCPLYTRSYPYFRRTIYNFLLPKERMDGSDDHGVTVTTQLTLDRYPLLEEMVAQWRGPLSVAFFALDIDHKIDEVEEFTKRYHENPLLNRYATIHLVYPDERSISDEKHLPINYLRNVALNGARTADVFLLDIGTLPAFTSQQATSWVREARVAEDCDKCVFIAPLFDAISPDTHIPNSKEELVHALDAGTVKRLRLTSHSSVPVPVWMARDHAFEIKYKENMEPYFVAGPSAPLISEMYVGYGRDKCAYSTDVFHTGHRFFVLPNAFLVRKVAPKAISIFGRSGGIQLRMFTNIAFHFNDIDQGYFRYRNDAGTPKITTEYCTTEVCLDERSYSGGNEYTVRPPTDTSNIKSCEKWSLTHFVEMEIIDDIPNMKDHVILEKLVKTYNVGVIIVISQTVPSTLITYIYLTHPDVLVLITEETEAPVKEVAYDYVVTLRGIENISSKLAQIRDKYTGPSIIWNMLTDNITEFLVNEGQEGDILIFPNNEATNTLLENICVKHASWRIFAHDDKLFIKSLNIKKHPLVSLPPSPNLLQESIDVHIVTVDIILFTKNRPLQTLAFMKSLAYQVTGINKVYVQYVADGDEFEEGYSMVAYCVSKLDIVLVPEKERGFRDTFLGLLESSTASHVMLAVDELIWIRPVDLRVAADILHRNQDTTATFQLRLGQDVGVYTQIKNTTHVFRDIYPEQDILAYYPFRLPYDFGYLMHVDGLLMSKSEMFKDFSETLTRYFSPSSLESRWVRCCLQSRARKWHLMYKTSRVFNNILPEDKRVMNVASPEQSSYELTRRLLEDNTEIDVEKLTRSVLGRPVNTHMKKPVSYTTLRCN